MFFTEDTVKQQIEALSPNNKTVEEQRSVFRKIGLQIYVYPDADNNGPVRITFGKDSLLKERVPPSAPQISKLFIDVILSNSNL